MTTDTVGGVWSYSLELIRALARHDVEVTLATMGTPLRPDQRAELAASGVHRAYGSSYALEWMDDPWADVDRAGDWLLRLSDELQPDVVHLNGYAHGSLDWGVPTLVVGHSDVLSWHDAVRGEPAGPQWDTYRERVSAGIAGASVLVAPTRAMLGELQRLYRLHRRGLVVANGSERRFAPHEKRALILTAGRMWDEAKNVGALAHVAPRLPWPVIVAGDGDVPASLTALGRLNRPQMDRAFEAAAIFAEPARYEPFGLAALEAGRAGCALVLGDIPSLREVWGDAALFVPPDDHDALERALASLIADGARRTEYARRARDRSLAYSSERMARGYLGVYQRALRPQRAVVA